MRQPPLFATEQALDGQGVAGVDEAGRGPLAGPVVAAAVLLDPQRPIIGLNDSKKLSERRRLQLADSIRELAIAWQVVFVEADEIDRINILQATLKAMRQAVEQLQPAPLEVLVDGNRCPQLSIPARAIVGGDGCVASISAASILAKTERDRYMHELDARYPGYGFARHKGYGTAAHLQALAELGACVEHRRSFAPVARVLSEVGV